MLNIPAKAGRSVNFLVQFKRLNGDNGVACPTKLIRSRATGKNSPDDERCWFGTGDQENFCLFVTGKGEWVMFEVDRLDLDRSLGLEPQNDGQSSFDPRELTEDDAILWLDQNGYHLPNIPAERALPEASAGTTPLDGERMAWRPQDPVAEFATDLTLAQPALHEFAGLAVGANGGCSTGTYRPDAPDFESIVRDLRRDGKGKSAALVSYMKDHDDAPFDDIKDVVHGDKDVSDGAVRKNVCETNKLLVELGVPLEFATSLASYSRVLDSQLQL